MKIKYLLLEEYIDNWDTGGKDEVTHENTDIAFSPSIIGGGQLVLLLLKKTMENFNSL